MEDNAAHERHAEQNVYALLKDPDQPISSLLAAYAEYRVISQANGFANFASAEKREAKLWQAHTDGKRFFSTALKRMRKSEPERPVETRQLIKLYLHFLKASERFYRGYIHNLSATFGGIPELEAVAQQVKSGDVGVGESSHSPASTNLKAKVLASCHQTLIYLGDLSRYRASDKLDKTPDFGPALGYYGLACTLYPSSGLGQHQQAVVALEQRHHLRAIYHLYRAIVVADPHPNATNNLQLEFAKVNSAFKKGELLPKSAPSDPEGPKRMLTAWFVRMHSLCSKGERFKEHKELEQTLLNRLEAVIKLSTTEVDTMLMRMVMVNLAAQYNATEMFKVQQTPDLQQAFFYFIQLNVRTYTTLLRIFCMEVSSTVERLGAGDDPAARLTPAIRRILPALRVYSSWLLSNVHILAGLASDDTLKEIIGLFWQTYTHALSLMANDEVFGIWALEDFRSTYMFEEDVDTIGFKPLQNEWTKLWRNWGGNGISGLKPRFSDHSVVRMSPDDELLARLMGLLDDGMYLAYEVQEAPLTLLGTKVYNGEPPANDVEAHKKAQRALEGKAWPKPKPLSYAAAAAKSRANGPVPVSMPNGASATSGSRQAQLSRMVDELVDDDDGNNPVTPPQQHTSNPAVVPDGDVSFNGMHYNAQDFAAVMSHQPKLPSTLVSPSPGTNGGAATPPNRAMARNSLTINSVERLQSVSTLWNDTAYPLATSPSFPPGLPTGTLSSPAQIARHTHSRVNSASSVRSKASVNVQMGGSWSSLESASRVQPLTLAIEGYANFSASSIGNPLLFGAGNNMWSTGTTGGYKSVSPPNGQGG